MYHTKRRFLPFYPPLDLRPLIKKRSFPFICFVFVGVVARARCCNEYRHHHFLPGRLGKKHVRINETPLFVSRACGNLTSGWIRDTDVRGDIFCARV